MVPSGTASRMLAAVGLCAVAITGCSHFEHPLTWDESPVANDVLGSWRAVEGDEAGSIVAVSRAEDQGLRFQITYPDGTPATVKEGKHKHRAEFGADLLGFASVAVLQIEASTYGEYDEEGRSLGSAGSGYLFRRVKPLPDGTLSVHRLDRTVLGQVTESEFADSGLHLTVDKVHGCLGDDLRMFELTQAWKAITGNLDGELKVKVIAALGEENPADELAEELDNLVERFDRLNIDAYRELARLRTCIARYLPSTSLEQVFASHADQVFAGGVDLYVRD
ncbi:MAG: hypothetical protein OXQ90_12920 [Gammaproteobacteria bacterium]|nr:hypothetical protein [Gammaproteobacteria bacterium]